MYWIPGMSVSLAVIGNCQAIGVADSLKRLVPDANVERIALSEVRSAQAVDEAAARIPGTDVVFSQYGDDVRFASLRRSAIEAKVGRFVPFPKITFLGFHPDMLFGYKPGGKTLSNGVAE